MAAQLLKIRFRPELLPLVRKFDCRQDRGRPAHPWEEEINEWIKADPSTKEGACYRVQKDNQCRVWLYLLESDDDRFELVGYSSLGRFKWPDPSKQVKQVLDPELPQVPISIIPAVGIQTRYQRGPDGAKPQDRYSTQIMDHLVYEARETLRERQPYLGLNVHPDNVGAIKFYRRYGFIDFANPWTHPVTGTVYPGMILSLRPVVPSSDC